MLGYKVDDTGREQYNKGIDQTKQKQQSLTSSFLKANLVMGVVSKGIGAAFGFIRDSVVGTTAETERYRVALGTMLGDQEKANKTIRDLDYGEGMFEGVRLSDFYETASAIGGLQNMVTFGMKAEEAGDVLARLGDIAQGDSEAFNSMSNAMGQVFATGKADSVKLKQFATKGFDVVGEVAKQTGKSREEIQKTGVTYEQTAAALRALTNEGGKYHGMLNKQMNTLGGIIKQYKSFQAATAEAIGFGITDDLKELLKYILQIGRAGQESFVNGFVKVLKEVIHWIWQVIIMFKVLGFRLSDMGDALAPVKQFFSDLKEAAGDVIIGIMVLAVELGKLIIAAFRPIQAFVSPIIKELGAIAKGVFTAIANFIRPLIPMVSGSASVFSVLGQGIAGLLRPVLMAGVAIKGIFAAIAIGKGVIAVYKAAAVMTKIWTGIQAAFNAVMAANPIALIIIGVIALIAAIILLIKNWDKVVNWVKTKFPNIYKAITDLVENVKAAFATIKEFVLPVIKAVVEAIKGIIGGIVGVVKSVFGAIFGIIKNTFGAVIETILGIFDGLIGIWSGSGNIFQKIFNSVKLVITKILEGIKKIFVGNFLYIINIVKSFGKLFQNIFDGFRGIVSAVVNSIKAIWQAGWNKITGIVKNVIEDTKADWNEFKNFLAGLWDVIVNVAKAAWDILKSWFAGLVDGIKNIWNGIVGFFSGLWEAIKKGPAEAIEYIKNAFFGLFDTIQQKLFGFINKIKEGWESVKGFFGGLGEGVVNFFTGGKSGGQMQPAYTTASQSAVADRIGQTSNYAYNNTTGGNSTVNAHTSISVNVPAGTSQEQSEAIARQVDAQFNARLAGSINSSRANIPSPEMRRY